MSRASDFNADDSPTGRISRHASATSVEAAENLPASAHRDIIYRAVVEAGANGLTSIEVAPMLPLTAQGGQQVSNRSSSRLQELWELGKLAVLRERGVCQLGVCQPHDKADRKPHLPTAPCDTHGQPRARGGANIWIATEGTAMTFSTVSTPPQDFIREDNDFGRPLVIPVGGGKPKPYTRCTTYIDALEDKYAINAWEKRMVAIGLLEDSTLMASVANYRNVPKKLDIVCKKAKEVAKASQKADLGTALHGLTEKIDRGLDVGVVPDDYLADLAAYQVATDPLTSVLIEQPMVLDDLKIGGTPDRLVKFDGNLYIADIKTGRIDYGMGKIAMQLAVYARSKTYDVATGARDVHGADTTKGIVIHMPAGEGTCTLWWVDLLAGWEGVMEARRVRAYRNLTFTKLATPFVAPVVQPGPDIPRMIATANTVAELTAVWNRYSSVWTDELTELAKVAKAAIEKDQQLHVA